MGISRRHQWEHPPGHGHVRGAPAAAHGHEEGGPHDRHEGHSVEMFRDRFWITLLLSIPTLEMRSIFQASGAAHARVHRGDRLERRAR